MSIIPGIENAAPDRTETSRGFFASPNFLPTFLFDLMESAWLPAPTCLQEIVCCWRNRRCRLRWSQSGRAGPADRPASSRRVRRPCRRTATCCRRCLLQTDRPTCVLFFGRGSRVVCFGHFQGCFTHVWCLPRCGDYCGPNHTPRARMTQLESLVPRQHSW